MKQTADLFEKLNQRANESPEWKETYDSFVERLRLLEMGRSAPSVGCPFPALALPDDRGRYRDLGELHRHAPLVVSFNRGGWCPYCRHELESWRDAMPALGAAGGQMVVIAGETAGRAAALRELVGGEATVLCDVDHGAALELGLTFHVGSDLMRRYREFGLDLADIYGSDSGILPIPATFVIDRAGIVRFAFVDPDFRVRAEPREVIAVVASLRV